MKNFLITLISIVVVLAAMYLYLNRDSNEAVKVSEDKKTEVVEIENEPIIPEVEKTEPIKKEVVQEEIIKTEKPKLKPEERIQVKEDSVEFYSDKGKLTNIERIDLTKYLDFDVKYSRNRDFISINKIQSVDPSGEAVISSDFVILSKEGKLRWEVEKQELDFVIPAPNGNYAIATLLHIPETPIRIYTRSGDVKLVPKNSRVWKTSFSMDGDYFAVIVQTFYSAASSELYVYNNNFDLLFKKKGLLINDASFSPELEITDQEVIVGTRLSKEKIVLDLGGNILSGEIINVDL